MCFSVIFSDFWEQYSATVKTTFLKKILVLDPLKERLKSLVVLRNFIFLRLVLALILPEMGGHKIVLWTVGKLRNYTCNFQNVACNYTQLHV